MNWSLVIPWTLVVILALSTAFYRWSDNLGIEMHARDILRWAKMHARLMRDTTAQQKANRVKRRKLRGLRDGNRWYRSQLTAHERLNSAHCLFLVELEARHPELRAEIEAHQQERATAL